MANLRLRGAGEGTDPFRDATDFRFDLEALTTEWFVWAAELLFTLAGVVLATFFFAALLVAVCFRFVLAFWVFTVFFAFLAIVFSKV